ncbi:MAG: hypothetical protein ACE5GZ_14175 [Gammaproteobacteria bacterium]
MAISADNAEIGSEHKETISELLKNGSIELTSGGKVLARVKDVLPYSMSVYTPSLPGKPLDDVIDNLRLIQAAGFNPVPHIAAKRVKSKTELNEFLKIAVDECGVRRVLLIGGDLDETQGPYRDAIHILEEDVLTNSGIREVGLAGYPEGHPRITKPTLDKALDEKIKLATARELGVTVVTQFSFNPSRIVDYCAFLSREYPDILVYIGMAGPTSPTTLLKYAKICGVSASLRALSDMGFKAAQLVSHPDPKEQLEIIARYVSARDMPNVLGVHVFSFGGFVESANWMQKYSYGLK